jgi:hypothetical protein
MPTLQAQIQTERASRYLVQLCKHAAAMGSGGHTARMHLHAPIARREVQVAADWSDTTGTVTFAPWGHCTLAAEEHALTLRIDAADDDGLTRIREVIDRDLQRFSQRDPVTVTWRPGEPAGIAPVQSPPTSKSRQGIPRWRLQTIVLALAAVLLVALHVGLAGVVVAKSRWIGIGTNVVVALVALKLALVAWARLATRRRRARLRARP